MGNKIFTWLLTTNYVQSLIIAQVRHIITVGGALIIAKGYGDSSMVEGLAGFLATAASFWLAQLDVKVVDTKIKEAFAIDPNELEVEETKILNTQENK